MPVPEDREDPESRSPDLRDETTDLNDPAAPAIPSSMPERIARYRIERMLGAGGFGCVYLARDEQLNRRVAVKVPRPGIMTNERAVERYLHEARTLASLDHPNIVPVFDVGRSEQFPCYLVSKFIEGTNLANLLKSRRLAAAQAARHVEVIAEALDHAHQRGLYHRDIKPANILVDSGDTPFLTDFGLALKEEELGTGPRFIGSPFYMSPEQARGEGHLVDGRTDIFSLGVVLYEMLTGNRPFNGDTPQEVLRQVQSYDARPPREFNDSVPEELERICLKAMSKRASDRYASAADFAADLRWFIESSQAASDAKPAPPRFAETLKVVPKGLRSFDANDRDFFLELLPGPWDREGLPESIRFWKHQIEERDAERTFRVGLIYGPSGCGKSSLVKAGLLPRLNPRIVTVYVEATSEDAIPRIERALGKGRPELSPTDSLKEHLSGFRRGSYLEEDQKLLLVIDQFEQYLHARSSGGDDELISALRQCDGERVQCLLLIRDDFWMAMTEFMRELEVRIVEGRNSAPLDLFDSLHARNVLAQFGRAYSRLPTDLNELNAEQDNFLDEAVGGLSETGKVIPVRLSLFAEMIKGRPWTSETIHHLGGMEGVGASFLEESFSASTAPPEHRRHQKAARAVLAALMPERGAQITGHLRSYGELLEASGYAQRTEDFEALLRILNDEVRLITPVDREGADEETEDAGEHTRRTIVHLKETKRSLRLKSPARYYKLTHDYLVPSLRQWLAHKQRETRRGRANLRLTDLSSVWSNKPDNRFLPGLWDATSIWLLSDHRSWGKSQQHMMRRAAGYYATRFCALAVVLLLVALAGLRIRGEINAVRAAARDQQAKALVDALLFAPPDAVRSTLDSLTGLEASAEPLLSIRFHDNDATPQVRLRAAFGLAACGIVQTDFLVDALASAEDAEVQNFATALEGDRRAIDQLPRRGEQITDPPIKARFATVMLDLRDPRLARQMFAYAPDPTSRSTLIHSFLTWRNNLEGFATLLKREQDPACRSGLCAIVGLAEPRLLLGATADELLKVIAEIHSTDPRADVHSAAGQVLRVHVVGFKESNAQANGDQQANGAAATVPGQAAWYQNRTGMTMLRIPSANEFNSFFLSDREVSQRLFSDFINDAKTPADAKPTDWKPQSSGQESVPARNVSWNDAVLFCNWLSIRCGRKPGYTRTGAEDGDKAGWSFDSTANGYRLPLEAEWEHACRGGATTTYAFGDDPALLPEYATFSGNSRQPKPGGMRLSNPFGCFDMHGNVWEWCDDGQSLRGGSYESTAAETTSAARISAPDATQRQLTHGFRVAHSTP